MTPSRLCADRDPRRAARGAPCPTKSCESCPEEQLGNLATLSLIQRFTGAQETAHERDADRVAATVEDRFAGAGSSPRGAAPGLPSDLRERIESVLDEPLADVAIHTDGEASALTDAAHAEAFTHRGDVYFREGRFRPDTRAGRRLIAHEMAHVAQQRRGLAHGVQRQARPDDSLLAVQASTAVGGGAGLLRADAMVHGFGAAGPDAIGIIAIPRAHSPTPMLQQLESTLALETLGHTAVYVRVDGRVTIVRGFGPEMSPGFMLRTLLGVEPSVGGGVGAPATITNDVTMFEQAAARTVEWAVPREVAVQTASRLPAPGVPPAGEPQVWTGAPNKYPGGSCEGPNCVTWALGKAGKELGGPIGETGKPYGIADTARGGVGEAPGTGSQGLLIRFIDRLLNSRGEATPIEATPAGATPGRMSTGMQALTWLNRGVLVGAPILDYILSRRAGVSQSRSGARAVGTLGTLASFPQLYGAVPSSSAFGMKTGTRAGGIADMALNLVNLGAQLLGAPEPVTALTETAASLTPSATIGGGARSFADFLAAGFTEGAPGLERVHEEQMRGSTGGVLQGYSMIGGLLAGEDLSFLNSEAAKRGDYGIFVQSGNYWGEILTGERSLTDDLGDIWDWIWD